MNTTTPVTDAMVCRFLAWKLPQNFCPDCHISFDREKASQSAHSWPTGTNLLHAAQARAMLEHVLGEEPAVYFVSGSIDPAAVSVLNAAPDTRPKPKQTTAATSVEPENKQLDDQLTDKAIEDYVKANGLDAPLVTLSEFNANIVHTEVVKHVTHSGQVLRWAILTTRNGFAVTGRPSCSASSENDNPPLGTQVAIDNARSELWPLMGYALRERLAQGGAV